MENTKKYYCYKHIRLDTNAVFYVGVGTIHNPYSSTNTQLYQRAYNKTNRNRHWKRIVEKAGYKVEIFYFSDIYDDVLQKEMETITLYKRTCDGGSLCNMTLGGEGSIGLLVSDETRKKRSDALKGRVFSQETIEKIRAKNLGKKRSLESLSRMSKSQIGKKLSPETKEKLRLIGLGKKHSIETKLKITNSKIGKQHSEDTKRKIGEKSKGRNNTNNKKVLLVEDNIIFNSGRECATYLGVSFQMVSAVLTGNKRTVKSKTVIYYG